MQKLVFIIFHTKAIHRLQNRAQFGHIHLFRNESSNDILMKPRAIESLVSKQLRV